ncbi:MAG: AAA family ATPase [Acidobacteriota bacterium]
MYTNFFRLNEPPFSLTPDPRYLYMSERHREGLAHLLYGVQQPGGFIQLTGEIGCGKTTLCRCLVSQLPADTDIALILNPRLTVIELLAAFCDELRIEYPAGTDSVKVLIDSINKHLLEMHSQGRRTVLVIDEAQNLHREVLEQIRLLTNLETEQEKLLQIILIGQPELISVLKDPGLKQLAQRITARYHLLPLSRQETFGYIQHRLFIAGLSTPIFSGPALSEIFKLTAGVPRLINILCDRALLGAYTLDKGKIGKTIVRKAAREIRTPKLRSHRRRLLYACISVVFLILVAAVAFTFNISNMHHFGKRILGMEDRITGPDSRPAAVSNTNTLQSQVEEVGIAASSPGIPVYPEAQGEDRIEDIVGDPSLPNSLISSFNALYSYWGVPLEIKPSEMGCTAGRDYGFECLFMVGNWIKIRRLDIPVILRLQMPGGEEQHIALVGLNGNMATMAMGGNTHSFPVQDVDRFWDGSFILIWKPPFETVTIPEGMRGKEIEWVRKTLDVYEGKPENPAPSDLFDDALRLRILHFQKTQFLVEDGLIGPETLLRLTLVRETPKVPMLSQYGLKGERS